MELWEILVPTTRRVGGKPYSTRYHRVWDAKVRAISGGLTIMHPTKNGQWEHHEVLHQDRMIPVRVMCNREQLDQILNITVSYYDQLAIMAYKISDEVIMKTAGQLPMRCEKCHTVHPIEGYRHEMADDYSWYPVKETK
jgi:hypothetical protein